MLLFLLQTTCPPSQYLGPWGQLLLFAITCGLGVIGYRQRQWRSTADAAVAALGVATTELAVWKDKSVRQGEEIRGLIAEVASLHVKTDLKPLVDSVKDWTVESRGHFQMAMQRLEEIHSETTATNVAMCSTIATVATNMQALTAEIMQARVGRANEK